MKPVVLVADDDEDILELLAFRLKREGYQVLVARDGEHALAIARERRPAVAVLDVSMPRLDGLEVARAIRADELDTRIVLLTARAREEDVRRGIDVGVDGYITKPFSPAHLGWRLAQLLG
jgi:DNA-binding response OmpR family regulator